MKRKEMKNVRKVGNTFVTEEELRETMYGSGRYGWCKIREYMCNEEGCMFPVFAEAVWILSGGNKELAFGLICMMLKKTMMMYPNVAIRKTLYLKFTSK